MTSNSSEVFMDKPVTAYLGLGSNLENPIIQIDLAIKTLQNTPKIWVMKQSSYYQSLPLGPSEQPDYINAVIEIKTTLEPFHLRDTIKTIEKNQGRLPTKDRWGARIIDIDILLWDNIQLLHPLLTIPHTEMTRRNFVLIPLAELNPDLQLPTGQKIQELIAIIPKNGLKLIKDAPI